jgi:hypothetical protein
MLGRIERMEKQHTTMNKQKREKKRSLQREPEWVERRARQIKEQMLGSVVERRQRHAEKEKKRRQQVELEKLAKPV